MDIEALPDLSMASDKLEELFFELGEYGVRDEEHLGEEGFWRGVIEDHLCDYSMQYFLSTSFEEDDVFAERMPPLLAKLAAKEDLIAFDERDFSLSKMEDLNSVINAHMCRDVL